jgi:predicted nucleotidyltransferase
MIMLKTAKKQQNKRKKLMTKEKNKIEIEAFKLEAKKSENLIKNAKKYIKISKEIGKKYGCRVFTSGSFGTKRFSYASDLDIVIVIPDENLGEKILIELRKKIKNPKVNFHIITKDFLHLYKKINKK